MQNLEGLDQKIQDDWITNRKRFELSQEQCAALYSIIDRLEAELGIPPTWLQVRQDLLKQCPDALEPVKGHPFVKSAFIWDGKIFMTEDLNYCSTRRFNDDFLTF